jgi:uncharacterized protein (TIGR03435 family)
LLSEAYGFSFLTLPKDQYVGLPSWAESQRFAINAKVDPGNVEKLQAIRKAQTMTVEIDAMVHRRPTPDMQMLQQLLQEHFHLKMHYEKRTVPVYVLTVAKGGTKMAVAHPKDPEQGSMSFDNGKFTGENVPADFIPFVLSLEVERPVVNQTNLSGAYDFAMTYTPQIQIKITGPTDETAPSVFTALTEQMGLKLVPDKQPVWVIVVDHIEMPADN